MNQIPSEVERIIHAKIPISQVMGISVVSASSDGIRLRGLIAANLNDKGTAFGGSAASIAFIAAWTWLSLSLEDAPGTEVVIQKSEMQFDHPIRTDFDAVCAGVSLDELRRSLARKGSGRVILTSEVWSDGRICATMLGTFVAMQTRERS